MFQISSNALIPYFESNEQISPSSDKPQVAAASQNQ